MKIKHSTFVILAHPEINSFNGHWFRSTIDAVKSHGREVVSSDLVTQNFDPVERRNHYESSGETLTPAVFDPLKFQESAARDDVIPADVAAEIAKIEQADRLVFHFPMWWFGPPAILKGWFDRCLMHGAMHTSGERFDRGRCRGKTAMFCVTTGSSADESAFNGKEGDAQMLLWPLAYALRYLGFTVLEPCFVHGVHGYHKGTARLDLEARLLNVLDQQGRLMANFESRPKILFNGDDHFDERGRLKSDAPSYTPFIRQSRTK